MPNAVRRRPLSTLLIVALAATMLALMPRPAAAVSSNDDIADAIDITTLPFAYDQTSSGDSMEANEPSGTCNISGEEGTSWYTFTAPANTTLGIDTSPSWAFASVAVYSGGPVMTNLTEVACSRENLVEFGVTSGTTYWLQVAGYDGSDVEALYATFVFGRIGTITGTVTHPVDGPLEGESVRLYQDGETDDSASDTTDVSGDYSLTVIEGDWNLRFIDYDEVYAEEWYEDAYSQATSTTVPVSSGGTTVADFSVAIGATVNGTVRDFYSNAVVMDEVEGNYVTIVNVLDDDIIYDVSIEDGQYSIPGIPAGTYALRTSADEPYGYNWSDGTVVGDVPVASAPSFVISEGEVVVFDALTSPSSFSGTVTDEKSGDPIAGVAVAIYDYDEILVDSVTTGSDGSWLWLPSDASEDDYGIRLSVDTGLYETEWHDDLPAFDEDELTYLEFGRRTEGLDAELTPINMAPSLEDEAFELYDFSKAGTLVGAVTGTDPNLTDTLSYAITAGNAGGAFAIDPATGEITVASVLDASVIDEYVLAVEVADDGAPSLTDTATVTISVKVGTAPPAGFIDVPDTHLFVKAIDWLAWTGVTKGCNPGEGNTKFCPDSPVTRGQMAAFLTRALGLTDNGGGNLFIDDDGSIFEADIDRLASAGITKGCNPGEGNTKFCPDSPVTRGQMAAFLFRALEGIIFGN